LTPYLSDQCAFGKYGRKRHVNPNSQMLTSKTIAATK
jgi:hypothetical protein